MCLRIQTLPGEENNSKTGNKVPAPVTQDWKPFSKILTLSLLTLRVLAGGAKHSSNKMAVFCSKSI